ncbi:MULTISPECIES: aminotransferase class V-fold PLP-dependent enzyme [Bradyrhizobium]|nr:aminotransferase class V-fold PLP-dependent enzyme [Bradyrhizobium diazoefficiens]MBP1066963.1 selenocysteine lyase/cysteine desulfurase [Bradyrhizobium japonicum]AWO90093.2 aminotransferase class V-fold PLP-dependent enzyme [Bradyrhizobium diazoefficiens]QLD45100.1 aminotransferase class V-fold PLP-dependent enzyme [Bradyrhizobium diazoefficiens]WLA71443.1 aminotransferase class V-fold PLP-dependent enzyme [Bradyrhizobium diazoefficiens]WLB41337.1 aminotransferase class V-fold PLP-dependen
MSRHYDVGAVRKEFPAVERITYLDAGFQTPLARPVKAAIDLFLREGLETAGPKSVWLDRVELTREKLARFLGVAADEIAFTKNTSESMNIAANALPLRAGDKVLMIHGDHPNNAYAFLNLRRKGVTVEFVPMTEIVNADSLRPHIDASTRAISMSQVTFHAGHRFDVESVGALCDEQGLYFVVDVMQAIGVVPIDAKAMRATFIGSGSHKGLLVPQGLGLLYWDKSRIELEPAYLAAASLAEVPADLIARPDQLELAPSARRFELGNFNLPAIHALGASLDMIEALGVQNIQNHCLDLGDHLIAGLDALDVRLVGPRDRQHRAPHIYVIALPAAEWLGHFEQNGVRVSPERDGIRVSFGMFNTFADVDRLIDIIKRRGVKPSSRAA